MFSLVAKAASRIVAVFTVSWACSGLADPAAEANTGDTAFFERQIQPVLAENCFECHSHQAEKIRGGLTLDSLAGVLKGGDTGPAVVPGKPAESLLLKAVSYTDPDLQMPPKNKRLSTGQIAALAEWVKRGAPWPGQQASAPAKSRGKITDEDRRWWSFQPVRNPKVPKIPGDAWARNPVDRFILARLGQEGLKPSPEGTREQLVRRVYFDLLGLPPSPEEVDRFLADTSPDAYEKLVDRLLASPRYGERWARYWLDLVRYAESDGYKSDDYRPNAWRYRDYVIKSFNTDKPYDLFVQEQLAGDELWPGKPDATIATAFLRHWIYEYNNRDVRGQWTTILNDLTDVAGDVFLGMGVQCARCHDHKFDPILQKDYYRLQSFFAPILPREDIEAATPRQKADYQAKLVRWKTAAEPVLAQIDAVEKKYREKAAKASTAKFTEDLQELIRKPAAERTPYEEQIADLAGRQITYEYDRIDTQIKGADKDKLAALRLKLKEFDALKPEPLPQAFTVTDVGAVAPATYLPKSKNQDPVEPGFPTVLDDKPAVVKPVPSAPNSTGRRAALARWIARPENPLTARVIVNRVWQYRMGRGLAANPSDLGHLGERPTHPELLDWLAARFVKDGWSFKKIDRLIVTSAAYRQSSLAPISETARLKDPENRLLWRGTTRRLDAEEIHDAILAATGELDLKMGGPAVDASKPRRAIYTRVTRNVRDPLLDVFDAPDNFASAPRRNVTTTPTQALLLMNGQSILLRARAFADRLRSEYNSDDAETVESAYRLAFCRRPSDDELHAALAFLQAQQKRVPPNRPATAPFLSEKMPFRERRAPVFQPKTAQDHFEVPDNASLPNGDFTIEATVLLRSIDDGPAIRTVAGHWDGDAAHRGWALGVAGRQTTGKPQSIVLQLCGGASGRETLFSGLRLELNKPYYLAASVKLSETNDSGVTFYLKDLVNDCDPVMTGGSRHSVTNLERGPAAFSIGGFERGENQFWDGLIDDVRLAGAALPEDQLLLVPDAPAGRCVGLWRFDPNPGVYKDASNHGNDIQPRLLPRGAVTDPRLEALVDLCHVLLNANEFIYVD